MGDLLYDPSGIPDFKKILKEINEENAYFDIHDKIVTLLLRELNFIYIFFEDKWISSSYTIIYGSGMIIFCKIIIN